MLERYRHLRQVTQLQTVQIQHRISHRARAAQTCLPAFEDPQGSLPANAGRRHPAITAGSPGKQPAIQLARERFIGFLPFGNFHARSFAPLHLFDHLQSVIIGECRFQSLQALCQNRNPFSRRDFRQRQQLKRDRTAAFERREILWHLFQVEPFQRAGRKTFGHFHSMPGCVAHGDGLRG
ncbi:hypothetical protein D3C78_446090 [compost metagenome]